MKQEALFIFGPVDIVIEVGNAFYNRDFFSHFLKFILNHEFEVGTFAPSLMDLPGFCRMENIRGVD